MPSFRPKDFRTIYGSMKTNLRNSGAYHTFRKESREVTDFYLTDEQRERLNGMKRVKRSFYQSIWILKAMFSKLSPLRQMMFILGVIFLLRLHVSFGAMSIIDIDLNSFIGGGLLVLLILLELKDKLLAHDELEAGRKIQESLMPERMPEVRGWSLWLFTRSANEVCGDLIDFQRLKETTFSIVMADVAGKGLHAALITAKLQATIRALAGEMETLPELIGRINAIVHRDSPSHIFSSLFYAECSEESGTIRFINAGHFPAVIISGSTAAETAKGNAALGLSTAIRFTEQSAELKSGDCFILYSDGLTEARNEAGEFFGKDRLLSLLRSSAGTPEQIGHAVLRDIDRFVSGSIPSDDLSIIILRRE